MPKAKAYVDLDLMVVDPKSLAIRWAGQASSKIASGNVFISHPERGETLGRALHDALQKVLRRKDFWEAFEPTQ